KTLLSLPGIGSYTSGAILSIAYGRKEPAVDGNVLRILSRVSADDRDILLPETKNDAEKVLSEMMEKEDVSFQPGAFNQALMDLGAMVCVPNGAPHCEECPLSSLCKARRENLTEVLPVRIKKTKRRVEERTVFLIQYQNRYAIKKRPEEGLLAGLYEFPSAEDFLSKEEAEAHLMKMGYLPLSVEETKEGKHLFSHVEWRMRGYHVILSSLDAGLGGNGGESFHTKEELEKSYALSSAFHFLQKLIQ
ncbi:MAG: NUDIX domain-containing protein, partial [Spirochaetales bacterium]|nr:NUDIX domain-containing protein [Candidatus Physcosoma equi]